MKNKASGQLSDNTTMQFMHPDHRVEGFFTTQDETLYCCWNSGFFSNCSITLNCLIDLLNSKISPQAINFSKSFKDYRTATQTEQETDLYPFYFKIDHGKPASTNGRLSKPNHHEVYRIINFDSYTPIVQKYFGLSDPVYSCYKFFLKKYHIDLAKTVAVVYRGTDKYKEVKLAEPNLYLRKAEQILKSDPSLRVLIQTDQKQVRDLFMDHFGDKCFFLEEMPVTEGQKVLHMVDQDALGVDKCEFGKTLLAATYLLSRCRFVVNHTGNMAFWICLFRGNSDDLFQFDSDGKLMPDSYLSIQAIRLRKKVVRRVSQWKKQLSRKVKV
jgi:hypothetical protein